MLQINKAQSEKVSSEQDTVDAFVALGGHVSVRGCFLFGGVKCGYILHLILGCVDYLSL